MKLLLPSLAFLIYAFHHIHGFQIIQTAVLRVLGVNE